MSLVLDASAALSWIFERTDAREAAVSEQLIDALTGQSVWVPSLWYLEVSNALLTAERRQVLSAAKAMDFLRRISHLPILLDDESLVRRQEAIIALARQLRLTAYDASYVELALRKGACLATFDSRLANAMQQVGGTVHSE
jgi:predicted nucleic acid-binding protein